MEQLKQMKEALVGCVQGQVYGNMDKVDAQELGAAIDMIKDLSEAIYYCTITEAMDEEGKEDKSKHGRMYYSPRQVPMMYHMPYPVEIYDPRSRERYNDGMMYAQGGNSGSSNSGSNSSSGGNNARGGGTRGYHDGMIPMYNDGANYTMYEQGGNRNYSEMMRDPREGRSGERRKMYMEGKNHKDKAQQMKELETYMQELSSDLTEMIQDASPEEKQMLQQKISVLATKIK